MAKRLLKDENILGISLVGSPANKREIVLFKSQGKVADNSYSYTKQSKIIKGSNDDWTTVYAIVEEPNVEDAQGDIITEEEIFKSCHNVDISKLFVDTNHDLKPTDNRIVESAIALTDMEINGEIIKKGSWYVAIEINDPATRELIEKGEIVGVSRYGYATAELIKGGFNDRIKTEIVIEKDNLINYIDNLSQQDKVDVFRYIAKGFADNISNELNNSIALPLNVLYDTIYDIYWENSDPDIIKSEIRKAIMEFLEYIENMTFIIKGIKGDTMSEEQVKTLIEKSVKEIVEKTIKETIGENISKEIIAKSIEQSKKIDTIETAVNELKEFSELIAKAITTSKAYEKDNENNDNKNRIIKGLLS